MSFVSFLLKIIFWAVCLVFGFLCLIPVSILVSGFFDWWDKAQHSLAFFCLSILGILAYQKSVFRIAIGLFFYGGLIEILQWMSGWRSGDLVDWLADCIGIAIGATSTYFFTKKLKLFE